jgi:hypothetical protein
MHLSAMQRTEIWNVAGVAHVSLMMFFKEHLMLLCSISTCMFGTEEQYMQQCKEICVFR